MASKKVICLLMSGEAHLPYLTVSLYTLRKHWRGRIKVFAWPESIDIVREIAKDKRLSIQTEESDPAYRARRDEGRQGKNNQFIHKIRLLRSLTDVDIVLYLDADTSVHGNLMPLFRAAKQYGFCATRFSSWQTNGSVIQARVKRLREFDKIDQKCVEEILSIPWPSVNGGVLAVRPDSPVLKTWEEWTWEARHIFIADEAVLHALLPRYVPTRQMTVWPDGRFNCSCNRKWLPEKMNEASVIIWHFHGDSAVRPLKMNGEGYRRWWPMWQECLEKNVGGCRDWQPSEANGWLGNKWFAELAKGK